MIITDSGIVLLDCEWLLVDSSCVDNKFIDKGCVCGAFLFFFFPFYSYQECRFSEQLGLLFSTSIALGLVWSKILTCQLSECG